MLLELFRIGDQYYETMYLYIVSEVTKVLFQVKML